MACSKCSKPTSNSESLFCSECNLTPLKILCVANNTAIRKILSDLLGAMSFVVQTASSNKEALEKIRCRYFDLVIYDLDAPNIDSKEFPLKIKEVHPNCPVVVLTNSRENLKSEKMKGVDGVIFKPTTLEKFKSVIFLNTSGKKEDN